MAVLVVLGFLMTALALVAVLWPLVRRGKVPRSGNDVAVYKDQLEEIERDLAAGSIGANEAAAARLEVSRRLIAAGDAQPVPTEQPGLRRAAAIAVLVGLPVVAASVYIALGSPTLPGQPLAERVAAAHAGRVPGGESTDGQALGNLVGRVEAYLAANPEEGRGWAVIAPAYMRLGRFADAVKAHQNAIRLLGSSGEREADLGEALVAAAGGTIDANAKAAFERAAAADPANVTARYYLGSAAEQDGKPAEAARIWREILAQAPADAPWTVFVRNALARVDPSAAPPAPAASSSAAAPPAPVAGAAGPSQEQMATAGEMTPEQRDQMIRGMVDRLAARLKQDGSDADAWLRLIRAYTVMGDRDKAAAAAKDARGALASDPEKLRRIDEGVKSLGLEG